MGYKQSLKTNENGEILIKERRGFPVAPRRMKKCKEVYAQENNPLKKDPLLEKCVASGGSGGLF